MKKLLIHAWSVQKKNNHYYLPYTHWIYLQEIIKYFDEIVLLSPCKYLKETEETKYININSLGNIQIYELPSYSGGYISSIKYFLHYLNAYKSIKEITVYYARYPTPFGWLQKLFGKNKKRIIHYVGDPIDAAKKNPNFSFWKKKLFINGFYLENCLYDLACKGAKVFTNGHHLSEKLFIKGIKATPLISSTLTEKDFYFKEKDITPETTKFIYLGYLRTAKGIETIISAFALYNEIYPNSTLTIIGSGELDKKLKKTILDNNIKNVTFLGMINDRDRINHELRKSDIFLFGSLSEGSPRVILEAMANGLAVISTPVGSLPNLFINKYDIIFSDFKNSHDFLEKMLYLTKDNKKYNNIRLASYNKVKNITINSFIKEIFHE